MKGPRVGLGMLLDWMEGVGGYTALAAAIVRATHEATLFGNGLGSLGLGLSPNYKKVRFGIG